MYKNDRIWWLLLLFQWPLIFIFAQTDAHYWTSQYGSKGLLLNGAVIASTDDETAVFYNPGALGSKDELGLSLSFLSPTYAVLKTENYLGQDNVIKDDGLRFTPGLAAAGFTPFKGNRNIRAALTSFTRFSSNIRYRGREVNRFMDSEDLIFIGNFEFERRLSERWFGFGMAYRVSDNFSFGATQFLVFHGQNFAFSSKKEVVHTDHPEQVEMGWRNKVKYSFSANGGMVTKLGLSYRRGDTKIGVTLTTPTYKYWWGTASYEFDDQKIFSQDSITLSSNLDGARLKDYKTPLSIGLGLEIPIGFRTRVSLSAEYFATVDVYTILEDVDDPLNGLSEQVNEKEVLLNTGNRRVINVALGWQTQVNDRSSIIWGFRTDFNQRRLEQDLQALQFLSTTPNIYHFSVGNTILMWNSKFSFGLDFGYGRKRGTTQQVNFQDVTPETLFSLTRQGSVTSKYYSILFIFAYDFSYAKKLNKKI